MSRLPEFAPSRDHNYRAPAVPRLAPKAGAATVPNVSFAFTLATPTPCHLQFFMRLLIFLHLPEPFLNLQVQWVLYEICIKFTSCWFAIPTRYAISIQFWVNRVGPICRSFCLFIFSFIMLQNTHERVIKCVKYGTYKSVKTKNAVKWNVQISPRITLRRFHSIFQTSHGSNKLN